MRSLNRNGFTFKINFFHFFSSFLHVNTSPKWNYIQRNFTETSMMFCLRMFAASEKEFKPFSDSSFWPRKYKPRDLKTK